NVARLHPASGNLLANSVNRRETEAQSSAVTLAARAVVPTLDVTNAANLTTSGAVEFDKSVTASYSPAQLLGLPSEASTDNAVASVPFWYLPASSSSNLYNDNTL